MALAENSSPKTARLETRVSPEQKELIERAAAYLGRSVSEFVVSHLEVVAKQVVEEYERLQLDRGQSRTLVEALLSPKRPNRELRKAVEDHRKRVTSR
ncbi:MAG: DUF1778 domain-containing protein [Planctomycetes bacterium]|nr:DUF1778 domain-containing protein [Planctomycetota bacterium]